jgi:ABC-type lipoprotein release transport system permease subunit
VLGCALGVAAGAAAIAVYHHIGLVLPIGESMAYTTPFDDVLYLRFFWLDHSAAVGATFVGCVLAGLLPAYRVYKFKVSEALRYL